MSQSDTPKRMLKYESASLASIALTLTYTAFTARARVCKSVRSCSNSPFLSAALEGV